MSSTILVVEADTAAATFLCDQLVGACPSCRNAYETFTRLHPSGA
jgi:hypothetical protein